MDPRTSFKGKWFGNRFYYYHSAHITEEKARDTVNYLHESDVLARITHEIDPFPIGYKAKLRKFLFDKKKKYIVWFDTDREILWTRYAPKKK